LAYQHSQEWGGTDDANWLWAQARYRAQRAAETHALEKYAVVTRKANPQSGRTITMIGLNHGRAAEGVIKFLTHENRDLQNLLAELKYGSSKMLPSHFQILFKVTMSKEHGEVEPESATPIRVHVYEPRGGPDRL
jgi:hypothetical protein